ncbi:MAG: hypothetical protein GY906_14450 [bacterium]|nr:hypothetical protein [bacterium]
MKEIVSAIIVVILIGCAPSVVDPDIVAIYEDGVVKFTDVEPRVLAALSSSKPEEDAPLSGLYKRETEELVLERILLAGEDDRIEIHRQVEAQLANRRRDTSLALYLKEQLGTVEPISQEEANTYFQDNEEDFQREAQRFLWHIYLRDEITGSPDASQVHLRELKQRTLAGESFEELAREYSHSETRASGGRLGWVSEGRFSEPLNQIIFSLVESEISDPIAVPGGVTIFRVTRVMDERTLEPEDVRPMIARVLLERRRYQEVADLVAECEVPEGSKIIDDSQLGAVLANASPDAVILSIGTYKLEAGDFLQRLESRHDSVGGLEPLLDAPIDHYRFQLNLQLAAQKARSEGFFDRSELDNAFAADFRPSIEAAMTKERLDALVRDEAETDEKALRRHFESNKFLFQTPLKLRLRSLAAPPAKDPSRQMAHLESLRTEMMAGKTGLDEVARRIGGIVTEIGWTSVDQLERFDPKVRTYVLEVQETGPTVPFQLNHVLHIIEVAERNRPTQMNYEDSRDRVVEDFATRHRQRLYRKVVDRLLKRASYRFHEENVQMVISGGEMTTDVSN